MKNLTLTSFLLIAVAIRVLADAPLTESDLKRIHYTNTEHLFQLGQSLPPEKQSLVSPFIEAIKVCASFKTATMKAA